MTVFRGVVKALRSSRRTIMHHMIAGRQGERIVLAIAVLNIVESKPYEQMLLIIELKNRSNYGVMRPGQKSSERGYGTRPHGDINYCGNG
jgi:hypothetical protein